jgi:superfamily I DNA/RNA helicase
MSGRVDPQRWRPVGVAALEPAAEAVVRSTSHHVVVAGPGAGKTELLAQRACFLLQTGACRTPQRILAISFKRDAAKNLRERVLARCGPDLARRFDSFTFDAFAKGLLDRFLGALPEEFRLPRGFEPSFDAGNDQELRAFMMGVQLPAQLGTAADLEAISTSAFLRDYIVGQPLPASGWAPCSAGDWAAREYWRWRLSMRPVAKPTFPMIGRLAELLLRTNPVLLAALRATYAYVFLDEFQDTTHVQYDLVATAFHGAEALLTAVGDNRQRIMGFAMALDDAFGRLAAEFAATTVRLQTNYRSAPELVAIQDALMQLLDPSSAKPLPAPNRAAGSGRCEVLVFNDEAAEATFLARLIEHRVRRRGVPPRDICLLVKQKPQDYAVHLVPALNTRGIQARNEAQHQDLLTEPLVSVVVATLRHAAMVRHGASWDLVMLALRATRPNDDSDGASTRRLERDVGAFRARIRPRLPSARTKEEIRQLLDEIMTFVGAAAFRQLHPQYRRGGFYERTLDDLAGVLEASRARRSTWTEALADFEGLEAVPLMTIHKSKGLEYDTVIFVGLEDYVFRNFAAQRQDEISAFFVAFSRAKEHVVFTFSQSRRNRPQARKTIGELYDLLRDAGVSPFVVDDPASALVE